MTDLQLVLHIMAIHILSAFLFLAIVAGIGVLVYAQCQKDSFDLRFLIVDVQTKQPSVHQLGQITALIISSWAFIVLVLKGQLTEAYFTTYMVAWAGANALNNFLSRGRPDNDDQPRYSRDGRDSHDNQG